MRKIIFLLMLLSRSAYAFDQTPVQFWAQPKENSKEEKTWSLYTNPNRLEFWKEGDYTPPIPLILAMKNPTANNISRFLQYLTLRASYMERFQSALTKEEFHEDPVCPLQSLHRNKPLSRSYSRSERGR